MKIITEPSETYITTRIYIKSAYKSVAKRVPDLNVARMNGYECEDVQ